MDMSEFHTLRHQVNVAATKIDAELGAARASNPPVDGNPHVQAAHAALGDLDKALIALDAWAKAQEPPETPPVIQPPPVTPGPGGSVGTVYLSGYAGPGTGPVRWTGYQNTIYSVTAGSAGSLSWTAASGGVKCFISRDPSVPPNSPWGAGASPELVVSVGAVTYMRFEGAASQGCIVSIPR